MNEGLRSQEVPQYTREQALAVFRPFVDLGVTHPDRLPLDDPEVMAANRVLDAWTRQAEQQARQSLDQDADLKFALSRTTFFVDAGFSDPDYVDEVVNDLLAQDLQQAEDHGLTDVAAKIEAKMTELSDLL